MTKFAVNYSRFSPRPGAAECESSERQLADLRSWCAARKLHIRGEYRDDDTSGADREREGLAAAIYAARRGDLFLVRDWSRLGRDTMFTQIIIDGLKRKGVEVRSITEQGDMPETPSSKLIRDILLAIADFQRSLIRAKTSAAMRAHQASGRKMGGVPPYGWRISSTASARIEEDPHEQEIIARMVEMRADGASYGEIADVLERDGIRCRGGSWHRSSIMRTLRRAGDRAAAT